jgi:hypothetical protein
MPRWYKGFSCAGVKPQVLINQLASQVQRYDLGHLIPVVRVEKRAGRGGYYLFLAIESPIIGQIPEAVQSSLLHLPLLSRSLDQVFTFDEIRRMVGTELSVYDNVRLIPYTRPTLQPTSDPFKQELIKASEKTSASGDAEIQTQCYDHLLYWLSATNRGSWQIFQNAWRILGGGSSDNPQQILRRLRLLGHLETCPNRQHWVAAPTVLLQISSGERAGQFALCGRRNRGLVQTLQSSLVVDVLPQKECNGPSTIYLHASNSKELVSALQSICQRVYVTGQAALQLAEALPSLDAWKQTLEALQGIRPHNYIVKYFNGDGFTEANFTGASGLYELWPMEDRGRVKAGIGPQYTLFYDASASRWLRADWYGLRFLARYDAGQSCLVQYKSTLSQLAVPIDWRWPELYERALVLASGRLPTRRSGWLIYDAISTELFDKLRNKLQLSNEETCNA